MLLQTRYDHYSDYEAVALAVCVSLKDSVRTDNDGKVAGDFREW